MFVAALFVAFEMSREMTYTTQLRCVIRLLKIMHTWMKTSMQHQNVTKTIRCDRKIVRLNLKIQWTESQTTGDKIRLMSVKKSKKIGLRNETSLSSGIKDTIKWYILNKKKYQTRYNSFLENSK